MTRPDIDPDIAVYTFNVDDKTERLLRTARSFGRLGDPLADRRISLI